MTTPAPQVSISTNTTSTVPASLTPQPRVPLVDRVTDLENQLAHLVDLHNKLAADTKRELGL